MEIMENNKITEIIPGEELGDTALGGCFAEATGQTWLDCRLTSTVMQQASAEVPTAVAEPNYIAVSDELVDKYGYNGA